MRSCDNPEGGDDEEDNGNESQSSISDSSTVEIGSQEGISKSTSQSSSVASSENINLTNLPVIKEQALEMLTFVQNLDFNNLTKNQRGTLEVNGIGESDFARFQEIVTNSLVNGKDSRFLSNTDKNIEEFKFSGKTPLSEDHKNNFRKLRTSAIAAVIPNDSTRTVFLSPSFFAQSNVFATRNLIHEFSHFDTRNANGTVIQGTREPQFASSRVNIAKDFSSAILQLNLFRE